MKARFHLGLNAVPIGVMMVWSMIVLFSLIVMVLAILSVLAGQAVSAAWQKGILLLQVGVLLPLPLTVMAQLAETRQVSLAHVWPRKSLFQGIQGVRNLLWLAWSLAALPTMVLVLLEPNSGISMTEIAIGPALAALMLALFAMQGAAWQGLVHPAWLLSPVPMLAWLVLRGTNAAWNDVRDLGPMAMAAAMLSLPMVLSRLQQRLAAPLRDTAGPTPLTPRQRFAATTESLSERWRYIDAREGGSALVGVLIQIPIQAMTFKNIVLVPWGDDVTGWYGLRILMLAFVVTPALRSRDLHWRWLLAPNGAPRRHLGQRIVTSTLASLAVIAGTMVMLSLPYMHWAGMTWAEATEMTASYGTPIALDLTLATALAASVRGMSSRRGWPVLALAGTMLAWLLAGWLAGLSFGSSGNTAICQRDGTFAAVTMGLAAMFTLLANRAWARADLGQIFRQGAPKADISEWGAR